MRTEYHLESLKMEVILWILSDDPRDLTVVSPTKYQAKQMESLFREAISTLVPLPKNEIKLGDGRKINFTVLKENS